MQSQLGALGMQARPSSAYTQLRIIQTAGTSLKCGSQLAMMGMQQAIFDHGPC